MAEQQRHYGGKAYRRKVDQTQLKAKEKKILNTEPDEGQDTNFKTSFLNVVTAANAFKSALKELKFGSDGNHECNKLQEKEIIKELSDIQNMIKLKILSLRNAQKKKTEEESTKTRNTRSATQSLFNFQSELTSKGSSSPNCTGNNSTDSKSEDLSTSKLKSLSKQSLCSTKSSRYDYLDLDDVDDDDDYDYDDDDDVTVEKFKEFLLNVHCPFCLKLENNTDSLAKHLDSACTPFQTKIFVETLQCPYSVFQLLPNNMLKCNVCRDSVLSNLRKYFAHSQSAIHVSGYNKVASRKKFTDLIFCASCKIQIPNNASQILFHMKHEVHHRNRKDLRSSHFLKQKGIQCVYSKEKKFKCLNCPPAKSIHKSTKEILRHVESEGHVKVVSSQKKEPLKTYTVYCMFCLEEVNVFNVLAHLLSSKHAHKEKEEDNNEFLMCFYCDFKCSKLLNLARHIVDCLDKIRYKDNLEREESDKASGQIEKDLERPTKENTGDKGRCIIVKGYPKILQLYRDFKEFGEILDIKPSGENAVMIEFREEKTVDEILESEKPVEINGVKLKITRKEDLDSSDVIVESSETAENTKSFPMTNTDGSDLSSTSRDLFGVSSPTVVEDFSEVSVDCGTLESLFNRVSSHLSYTALKPDCEDFLKIAGDCERVLKFGKCESIGFLKCGLTFPVEKITLYCELSNSFIEKLGLDDNSTSLTESVLFNENLCKKCVKLFNEDDAFSEVSLRERSFPLVEFYHKKTKKLCTITFRQSDNILADELRYCLKENEKLRSFVLIIRFWLSVHRLEIREFESVIISLLLFFVLSSGVVNTPSENFSKRLKTVLASSSPGIRGSTGRPQRERKNSIMELFQNFLLFLNEFDFENMAICLPFLYPVPKTRLLQEPLKKCLCKWFYPEAPVYILDPFLFNNVAMDVKKVAWDSLLKTARETIEHYHISSKT